MSSSSSNFLLNSLLCLVLFSQTTTADRATVSLNFGWRAAPAASEPPSCTVNYTVSLNNQRCMGLSQLDATDPTSCAAAACTKFLQGWQWLQSQGCWAGLTNQCGPSNDAWVGSASPTIPVPSPPPANSPEAQPSFDDSIWEVVDIPHDAGLNGVYAPNNNGGEGFQPQAISWYRKHFIAPSSWNGNAVYLVVDAALSTTTWWLNGKQIAIQNPAGYLPFVIRLDGSNGLIYNDTTQNLLAALCDGTETTGWWREGSGLIRSARLIVSSSTASIAPMGISSASFVQGAIHANGGATPAEGLFSDLVVFNPTVTTFGNTGGITATFTLYAADGVSVVASGTSQAGRAGDTLTLKNPININGPVQLWSVARPYLYTLTVSLSVGGSVTDTTSEYMSIRNVAWDGERGLVVNEQNVKMRGACNHETYSGVGAAIPDRIDLFRVQQLRGVGMNSWRTSHNPPEPILLDIADRLGILVLDENRVLATNTNCDGCSDVPSYAGNPASDVGALALRDRNHASVIWYSLCNEAGCGNGSLLEGDLVEQCKQAAYVNDGERMIGANMGWISPVYPGTPMSTALDVMGCSHCGTEDMLKFHEKEPSKPLVMTECCSCENQRGEDADQPHNSTLVHYNNEVAGCLADQVGVSDLTEYVAGTFVWTMHDYMGEPGSWPHVSSSFGAIDLAGFQKPPAWWYRSVWLANISSSDPGRPPLPSATTASTVRIVESWNAPGNGGSTRNIHVYSNAPFVQLFLNGASISSPVPVSFFRASVEFANVTFTPGTLTAKALAADGTTVLSTHSTSTWGSAATIVLSMDVPNALTGTGSKVYVDGADVALLRATIIDAQGNVVRDSSLNVSFAVTSGPGFISGVGNGDPACQEPNQATWRSAYHGLARAIVRVTVDASGSASDRALLAQVNVEAGLRPRSSTIFQGDPSGAPTSITVTASAPGLATSSFVIPLSVDPAHSVLNVASNSVDVADIGVLEV